MIKLFKLILILKFLLSLTLVNSYSASTTGAATVYKVTMKKVELCTASTGVSSCENAVIIGDTSKEVNIVDAAEGAAAANYGDPALLPLGTTYSHMRVTIDRKFTIKDFVKLVSNELKLNIKCYGDINNVIKLLILLIE